METTISECTKMIERAVEIATLVKSNQRSCHKVAIDLELIGGILSSLDREQIDKVNSQQLNLVLIQLFDQINEATSLFERSLNEQKLIKIKKLLQGRSIQGKLTEIHGSLGMTIALLSCVFRMKPSNSRSLGITEEQPIGESIFDTVQ
ncbi:unnamed protein product [Rotaria socialis]|uniref:Uncharacterized protein n=1 Tax=Rotaria socialis TaxID=392032 RepID=A0A818DTY2_9BILA|nr:unnamed protein product [Rotaria socialis]CAF4348917.1 unnamed protein product [Rotaria socialis]